MKRLKLKAVVAIFAVALLFSACAETNESTDKDVTKKEVIEEVKKVDKVVKEVVKDSTAVASTEVSKYICPNGCEVGKVNEAGDCKSADCGMELIENPDFK